MTTTIKYIIFIVLFGMIISLFLPVVTELPFGLDGILNTAVGMFKSLLIVVPWLQTPYEIFLLSIQLLFGLVMLNVALMFITRGNSGSNT